jgi:hypothetical protein
MEGEQIPDSWVGQHIDLVALDIDPSKHTVVRGAHIYSLGVRHVQGVLLISRNMPLRDVACSTRFHIRFSFPRL